PAIACLSQGSVGLLVRERTSQVVSRIFRTFGLAERRPALAHAVMALCKPLKDLCARVWKTMHRVHMTVLLATQNSERVLSRTLEGYCRASAPPVGWKL